MDEHEDASIIIERALAVLAAGGVVAFPTETVYGLGARIDRPAGLEKIFAVKQRPFFDPLIVHVNSTQMAKGLSAAWTPVCERLAEVFWPGPLTLVTEKNLSVSGLISSGLSTVGLRWPRSVFGEALIRGAGVGIAAPSANRFGRTSPTRAEHVRAEFGDQVMIIEGDESQIGIESTVLAVHTASDGVSELSLLRPGFVTKDQIENALGESVGPTLNSTSGPSYRYRWRDAVDLSGARAAPGRMKHHYMPAIPLVWVDESTKTFPPSENDKSKNVGRRLTLSEISQILTERAGELPREVEGVKLHSYGQFTQGRELDLSLDPALAARRLYAELRAAAEFGADFLVFRAQPEMHGELWQAVLERLTKATSLKLA